MILLIIKTLFILVGLASLCGLYWVAFRPNVAKISLSVFALFIGAMYFMRNISNPIDFAILAVLIGVVVATALRITRFFKN